MKWYKRDPAAALEGMIGLTLEERGAYNAVIDLCYARALTANPHVTDKLVVQALACRPQVWRRLRASLIAKGKIHEELLPDGKFQLVANRVDREVVSAEFQSSKMAYLGRLSWLKRKQIYDLGLTARSARPFNGAALDNQNSKKVSSSGEVQRASTEGVAEKKLPEGRTMAEINAERFGEGWAPTMSQAEIDRVRHGKGKP